MLSLHILDLLHLNLRPLPISLDYLAHHWIDAADSCIAAIKQQSDLLQARTFSLFPTRMVLLAK